MLVFGTRPEAIKMAPLIKRIGTEPHLSAITTVTGQHREMLDQVLDIFQIKPDHDLNIMKSGQDLTDVTCRVLQGMREILSVEKPDLILVHGDTATSTAAALSAFYQSIPVGHVEAGLRTGNILSPWPEEMNRRLTGRIATLHFAPTEASRQNLLEENVSDKNIFVTGNTVIDALNIIVKRLTDDQGLRISTDTNLIASGYDVKNITERKRKMILITGHRRENFGEGFRSICCAIKTLSEKYPECDFVYPMHLNPNVRRPISEIFGNHHSLNTFFIEPLDYVEFVRMMSLSHCILTDSGGIQEEAPGLGKPVLVMRETTERPEAIEAGTVQLVGTDMQRISDAVSSLIEDSTAYGHMAKAINPYGDGKAAGRIVEILTSLQF